MGWDGITPLRLRQLLPQLLKQLNVGKNITSLWHVICPSSGQLNPSNAMGHNRCTFRNIDEKTEVIFFRQVLISAMDMSANAVYIQI